MYRNREKCLILFSHLCYISDLSVPCISDFMVLLPPRQHSVAEIHSTMLPFTR